MKLASSHKVLLCLLFVATSFVTITQAQKQVFKVGDRVSASPLSLKDEKYWRSCTVIEVHDFVPKKAYSVTCDPQTPGGSSSSYTVNEDWVRPLAGGQEGNNAAAEPRQTRPTTAPPRATGPVACPPSDAGNGKSAMESSFRGAIIRGFERTPRPGEDGRVTVTVQSLSIGQPHGYRVLEDPNEARGKTIYPIRATFTTCTDYFRRIEYMKRERAFSCYKNAAGETVCDIYAAANTNVKDEIKSIDKPR